LTCVSRSSPFLRTGDVHFIPDVMHPITEHLPFVHTTHMLRSGSSCLAGTKMNLSHMPLSNIPARVPQG
jgi:hypothetical protein